MMTQMSNFYECENEGEFDVFMEMQHKDDEKLKDMFATQSHRAFQYSLINTGIMLDIVRGYFAFEQEKIDKTLGDLEKDKVKTRRVNAMLNELNQKINLRYELDEDTEIVAGLAYYQGEGYLYIRKALFAQLVIEKADIPL